MLSYTILSPTGDTMITFPLSMDNNPKNHDENDDFAAATAKAAINPIVNLEKEGYEPVAPYKMAFNFIQGSLYMNTWAAAGFILPGDVNKNVFKKSEFLIEFFDSNLESNNLLFNTTLSIYPNPTNGKGVDSEGSGEDVVVYNTFTVSSIKNELYLLFFNRDFSSLSNIKTDANGRYTPLYMKVMFLNAKNGKVQYFFQSPNYAPLTSATFVPTIYYTEVRFYENLTYAFYSSIGAQLTTLNFNEVAVL